MKELQCKKHKGSTGAEIQGPSSNAGEEGNSLNKAAEAKQQKKKECNRIVRKIIFSVREDVTRKICGNDEQTSKLVYDRE